MWLNAHKIYTDMRMNVNSNYIKSLADDTCDGGAKTLATPVDSDGFRLGVCGYTRTRGFTRTRPVPAGRVGSGRSSAGTGRVGLKSYGYGFTRFYP